MRAVGIKLSYKIALALQNLSSAVLRNAHTPAKSVSFSTFGGRAVVVGAGDEKSAASRGLERY